MKLKLTTHLERCCFCLADGTLRDMTSILCMCHCTPCRARLAAKLLSANCYCMADAGTCRVTSPTCRYSAIVHQNQGCQFCICLIYRWLVMVLRCETSACHGTTVRSMQPAALSLTATLLPRTRIRWPWLRAKVGHLCLLLLNKSLVAQGDSHQGHFVALTLQNFDIVSC